jgi:hypothetical protein
MGILIITVLTLIISSIWYKKTKSENAFFTRFFSILALVGIFLAVIIANSCSELDVISYKTDKNKIEMAINNPQITGEERASVIDLIIKDNSIILSNRYYGESFWFNIFVPKNVQQLELFDINKISYANTKVIK